MKSYLGVVDTQGKIQRDVTDVNGLPVKQLAYNGSTYDVVQGNTQGTLLASAARTATTVSPTQTNYNARGVILFLNVTAVPVTPGTGGLILKLLTPDPYTGTTGFGIILDLPVITTTGFSMYMIYPGVTAATGASSSVKQFTPAALPRAWNAQIFHSDGQAYTYSLGYSLII